MKPNDPFFDKQWYFGLIGDIRTVWNDWNGQGVHVGIYDNGIDFTNPDLAARHDASLDIVINGQVHDGEPNAANEGNGDHGTAVAGLIAASGDNGKGVIGTSWAASLASVNISDDTKAEYFGNGDGVSTKYLAGFLSALHQMANFDVTNNSWGYAPEFAFWEDASANGYIANGVITEYAFVSAAGRKGLGTVIVQAAGNEASDINGSNVDSSRFTISVAAALQNGFVTDYSNFGPSILITAPGSARPGSIVTTDLSGGEGSNPGGAGDGFDGSGDYAADFGGTSAAAPIVTGVVALMLQANPELGWRDVQDILAFSASRTGSPVGSSKPGQNERFLWQVNNADNWNGGGAHFSPDYGYGMVNAFNAARMAEAWKLFSPGAQTSANEAVIDTGRLTANLELPVNKTVSYSFEVGDDMSIEHIDFSLEVLTSAPVSSSKMKIFLISPDGTKTEISDSRPVNDWAYGLDNLHGEHAAGTWTLSLQNNDAGEAGRLFSLNMIAYGSTAGKNDVYHFTDEFSDMAALDAARKTVSDRNGGKDWIDAAAMHAASAIDLASGKAKIDGTALAVSGIENVVSGDGADKLAGNNGANNLFGMRGNDTLSGGAGKDRLTGGQGDDTFVFDSKLGSKNLDTLSDFSHADDTLRLDRDFFKGLGKGKLDKDGFHLGKAAADKEDRILYDKKHGDLYFDRDGTKTHYDPVKFAHLDDSHGKLPSVSHSDFFVV